VDGRVKRPIDHPHGILLAAPDHLSAKRGLSALGSMS
jgi:hypothetical protein